MIDKNSLEVLLNNLSSGDIILIYMTTAEVFQQKPNLAFALSSSINLYRKGEYEKGINLLTLNLNCVYGKLATELLTILVFMLVDQQEYYYSGLFNFHLYQYFLKGDLSDVAPLDKDTFNIAFKIATNRFELMELSYKMVRDVNNYTSLGNYRNSCGFIMPNDDINKDTAIKEIYKYFNKVKKIALKSEQNKVLKSLVNPVARKVYSAYVNKDGTFAEYVLKIVSSIDRMTVLDKKGNITSLLKEVDQIREMYRKVFSLIFAEISCTKKARFGDYFRDDFIFEFLKQNGIKDETNLLFKDFHALTNAISHITDEPVTLLESKNKEILFRYKNIDNKTRLKILLSPIVILSKVSLNERDYLDFDKDLEM